MMTRLLFLAALVAGAQATWGDSKSMYGDSKMYGDSEAAGHGSYGSNHVASDKSSSSESINVAVSVHVVSKCQGGSAAMEKMAEPIMPSGMTHEVTVGGAAGLVYSPPTIQAAKGDMVKFTFMSKNHTLTQSTFPKPCVKMASGVDSGFMPNPDNSIMPPPTYIFQVLDTKPTWFYCKQKTHCGKGMAFSINPTAEKSQDAFVAAAKQQNGTADAGMPPPGSYMPAPPPPASIPAPPPPPASMPAPPLAVSLPPAAAASPPAMPAAVAAAPAASGVVQGTGSGDAGSCSCSCLCGIAAFPAGAGIGMYGGISGAVPV